MLVGFEGEAGGAVGRNDFLDGQAMGFDGVALFAERAVGGNEAGFGEPKEDFIAGADAEFFGEREREGDFASVRGSRCFWKSGRWRTG